MTGFGLALWRTVGRLAALVVGAAMVLALIGAAVSLLLWPTWVWGETFVTGIYAGGAGVVLLQALRHYWRLDFESHQEVEKALQKASPASSDDVR